MVGSSSRHGGVLPFSRLDKGKGVMLDGDETVRPAVNLGVGRGVLMQPEVARGSVTDISPDGSSEGKNVITSCI